MQRTEILRTRRTPFLLRCRLCNNPDFQKFWKLKILDFGTRVISGWFLSCKSQKDSWFFFKFGMGTNCLKSDFRDRNQLQSLLCCCTAVLHADSSGSAVQHKGHDLPVWFWWVDLNYIDPAIGHPPPSSCLVNLLLHQGTAQSARYGGSYCEVISNWNAYSLPH